MPLENNLICALLLHVENHTRKLHQKNTFSKLCVKNTFHVMSVIVFPQMVSRLFILTAATKAKKLISFRNKNFVCKIFFE